VGSRIGQIPLLSILDIVVAIVLMLLLSSPISEAGQQAERAGQL
jgi:hypothetical protein